MSLRTARRSWTSSEDEQLRLLVSYWGDQCGKNGNWDKISANFDHRTAKDCRKRWFHSLDPKLKRGRWSEAEDKTLMEAFAQLGPSWQRVCQLIPGRTDDQCAKRYNDVLAPGAAERLREWTPQEDAKLMNLIETHGTKWRDICKEFDGRTGLTCRNRWRKLKNQTSKAKSPDSGGEVDLDVDVDVGLDTEPVTPHHHQAASLGPPPHTSHAASHARYSLSYENDANYTNSQTSVGHVPLAEADLERVLAFCKANNQKVVIHQHIYSGVPQLPQQQAQQSQPQQPQQPQPVLPNSLARPALALESTPQPDDWLGMGNFSNMDYLAFNPS